MVEENDVGIFDLTDESLFRESVQRNDLSQVAQDLSFVIDGFGDEIGDHYFGSSVHNVVKRLVFGEPSIPARAQARVNWRLSVLEGHSLARSLRCVALHAVTASELHICNPLERFRSSRGVMLWS